ncbi:MAG: prepilin-type N-terminal cleavage/methylation domain-containing protein, partial [Pirellulaceae bacterium]|nr:prepilin-type N-terminal cleavage/methylation domain-containing protein [Pirellulaceae bacterium]
MRRIPSHHRQAFTLVELLMVIAIIGILVGLAVPAVMMAVSGIRKKAFVMEVQTLANAVDQYKNKYGDYPPDGSDSTIFARHCRKLFPNIAATELTIVTAGCNCIARPAPAGVMDAPEALVFFLGGFSKDPIHPFTGAGGPFSATPSGSTAPYQYNTERNEPFFEFPEAQLSMQVFVDSGNQITVSNDESTFGLATPTGFPGDVMPVYHAKGKLAPFVYFDSRTYSLAGAFFNSYALGAGFGVARPYKASNGDNFVVNTNVSPTFPASTAPALAIADRYYKYANDKTYQIISAGLDDNFGAILSPSTFFAYPSGRPVNIGVAAG